MKHHEFLYLLHKAHILRRFSKAAEADGQVFHSYDVFVPLEAGVAACASIQKINPTDTAPVLILRLRANKDAAELVANEAKSFFSDSSFQAVGAVPFEDGLEFVFFSNDILKPVTLEDVQNRISSDDVSAAAAAARESAPRSAGDRT
jgi:hypothetical protein